MSFELTFDQSFPKTSRLLKKRDFFLRPSHKIDTDHFKFIVKKKLEETSRIGISISKKALKHAVARNRVKRLIRETFRLNSHRWPASDIHVIAKTKLAEVWQTLDRKNIENEFSKVFPI